MSELSTIPDSGAIEKVLISGDLSKLTSQERTNYYMSVCQSVGLNPLTQPFQYLVFQGKMQLYARKDCTEQLRTIHKVSVVKLERETIEGVYVVTAYAVDGAGRQDVSTGAVTIEGLKGEPRANAMMKSETKAKRRVTLSICGLGMLDETEVETIPGAQIVPVDEPQKSLPPTTNGNGHTNSATPEQWGKNLIERIRHKQGELIAASKAMPGELLETIEQAWTEANLSDQPSKWTRSEQAVGVGLVKSIIAEFEAREKPGENLDADPVDEDAVAV